MIVQAFADWLLLPSPAPVPAPAYPGRRPQGSSLPCYVWHVISEAPAYTDQAGADLRQFRVQVDCIAETYTGAHALASPLRTYAELEPPEPFQSILLDSVRDFNEGGAGETDYPYRVIIDLLIWMRT